MLTTNSRFRTSLTVCIISFLQTLSFSQSDNTFLYRITGNGLTKPSFLFGTVHLRDSRLFNFQDSLYSFIKQCDVFANEVDPDSLTEKVLEFHISKSKKETIGQLLPPEAISRIKKKYQYITTTPLEELTIEEIIDQSISYYENLGVKDQMATFMDMYLMGLAKDFGKTITGLEPLEDQLAMYDKLLQGKDPEKVLDASIGKKKKADILIKAYLQNDLKTLSEYVAKLPPDMEVIVLSNRNKVMVKSMMKLMPQSSVFAAIGAAHLPGSQGLLQLLRNEGFTVTPELSENRTHAKKFLTVKKGEKDNWIKTTVEKDGYEILMPGTPSRNAIPQTGGEMYTYIDWQHNEQYMAMHIASEVSITPDNRDSLLKKILQGVGEKGITISQPETIQVNGYYGMVMSMKDADKTFYKTGVFSKDNEVVLLMMGTPDLIDLTGPKSVRFMNSLNAIPKKMEAFKKVSDSFYGFSFDMPGKPAIEISDNEEKNIGYKQYFSKQGSQEFLSLVVFCRKGYNFPNDSATIETYLERITQDMDTLVSSNNGWIDSLFPLKEIVFIDNEGKKNQSRMITRGNRLYLQMYASPKEEFSRETATNFFNSFSLLPYTSTINLQPVQLDSLKALVPDKDYFFYSEGEQIDSSIIQFYAKSVSTTFIVFTRPLNTYYWAQSDSAFLHNIFVKDNDVKDYSVKSMHFSSQFGNPALDVELKPTVSHQISKWRYIKAGDKLFVLNFQFEPNMNTQWIEQMFDSFRVVKHYPAFDVTRYSAEKIFATLDTASVETRKEIMKVFEILPFGKNDLPLLFKKASIKHPSDTLSYPTLEEEIWNHIENLTDSTDVNLMIKQWKPADATLNYQSYLLYLLAKWHTDSSLMVLQKNYPLLQETNPMTGKILSNLNADKETLVPLITAWYGVLGNLRLGAPVLYLHTMARDSGWLEQDPVGYADSVLLLGEKLLSFQQNKKEDDYLLYADDVLTGLARLKSVEGNKLLGKLADALKKDTYLMFEAVELLIENGERPKDAIEYLAADPEWRSSLYSLVTMNDVLNLFPAKYLNQTAMAEAYLYDYLDDYYPDKVEPIGSRILPFEGKDYVFYLFKMGFEEGEEGMQYYLGVSGPFEAKSKALTLAEGVTHVGGIIEERFEKSKIEKQLKAFLKEFETDPEEEDAVEEEGIQKKD